MAARRERGRPLFRAAAAIVVAGTAAVAAVGACLPDVEIVPFRADASTAVEAIVTCGDGLIDTLEDGGDAGESCDPGEGGIAPGCEHCQVTCPGVIDDASAHCYFAVAPTTSQSEAANACGQPAHVVTIASLNEALLVDDFAARVADASAYWIGLKYSENYETDVVHEPGFPGEGNSCVGCFGLDDGGTFPVQRGTEGATNHNCLVADHGRWLKVPCAGDAGYATICEREPPGQRAKSCAGPFCTTLIATAGRKRYVLSLEKASASAAEEACNKNFGGSLVMLESAAEREQLSSELTALFPQKTNTSPGVERPVTFWIGASATPDGTWSWDKPIDAGIPWAHEQPKGDGARRAFMRIKEDDFDTQLAWSNDDTGDAGRYFVCERPAP
jgi:hypothetical protein